MKFRVKSEVVEAITFDEFVAYGLQNTTNIVNRMPWSFDFRGHPVTHENDICYLIPAVYCSFRFEKDCMLIITDKNDLYPCKINVFREIYEAVE